jgi:hypothetical protein
MRGYCQLSVHYQALILILLVEAAVSAQERLPVQLLSPREGDVGRPYAGTVTDITKKSITIQWIATPDVKPRTFQLSDMLAAGNIPMAPRMRPNQKQAHPVMPIYMYRITDVKVGDLVAIKYAHLNAVDICDHICIAKRPGGRHPPLPEEAEELMRDVLVKIVKSHFPPGKPIPPGLLENLPVRKHIPYNEERDAYWDLVDRGIPYPDKFGKHRRFPVAPMPRKLTLDGPVISK